MKNNWLFMSDEEAMMNAFIVGMWDRTANYRWRKLMRMVSDSPNSFQLFA